MECEYCGQYFSSESFSSIKVNTTGLNYKPGSETNSLVSGGDFTSARLNDGDKITVTHEITISGQ